MQKILIDESNFFKGYNEDEMVEIKKFIATMQKYVDKNRLQAAVKSLNNPNALKYPELGYYLVNLLIELGEYKIAYRVLNKINFNKIENRIDYQEFIKLKETFITNYNLMAVDRNRILKLGIKDLPTDTKVTEDVKKLLSILLTRIYANDVAEEEIIVANISQLDKNILLAYYYEKISKDKALNFVKQLKKNEKDDGTINIYNKIINRVVSKRNNFNIEFYAAILHTTIDYDLYQELVSKKIEEESVEKRTVIKNKIIVPKTVIKEEKKVVKQASSTTPEKKIVKPAVISTSSSDKKKKEPAPQNLDNLKIKDAFKEECDVLLRYLYLLMQYPETQLRAIKTFDNVEVIIDSPVTDEVALMKLEEKIICISHQNRIPIEYNKERFRRYYK